MRKRRIILAAVVLALLVGIVVVVWEVNDWPPPRLILKYGFPPTGGPTGRTKVIEGIEFVELKPGYFRMGSSTHADGGDWLGRICAPFGLPWGKQPENWHEMPEHWVEFRRGFWIATTEVTNAQYERFVKDGERCKFSKDDDMPVVSVSWENARRYCTWLAASADLPIRLPSEAEWECACRAGSDGEFTTGDDASELSEYAWSGGDWESGVHDVATKRPNRWGLYDLHGNVSEWCEDTWPSSYEDAPTDGSPWVDKGSPQRAFRGGHYGSGAWHCQSAIRYHAHSQRCIRSLGFRPAFSNPESE